MLREWQPTLSGEDLFQHARRLLIAEYQNVVYGEYLPAVLGAGIFFSLTYLNVYTVLKHGCSHEYSSGWRSF